MPVTIDKILSYAYALRMKKILRAKAVPIVLLGGGGTYPMPVIVPAPDPKVVARRAAAIVERTKSMQERHLLHRKNHIRRAK